MENEYNFIEDCDYCNGTGVIQGGSLEGNYCNQCEDGKVLAQHGMILAKLIEKFLQGGKL